MSLSSSRLAPRRLVVSAALAAAAFLGGASHARADEVPSGKSTAPAPLPKPPEARKSIDLVLCLDTSGSMNGLINAARQKMWEIVNECAGARPAPVLRVALYSYGGPGSEDDGYVIQQTPFTTDLDLVSEKLFKLATNGGTEYVGRVIQTSIDRLQWGGADAAKILFVAGNESADQDQRAKFRDVVTHAAGLGVRINAIYCGGADDPDAAGWREVAALGGGRYASIDMNHGTVAVVSPYDKELEELSKKVNLTYLAYGAKAEEAKARQSLQDGNAASAPAAGAARAASKASGLYDNGSWDLVDKSSEAGFDLAKIPSDDLPAEMRTMTLEQKKAWIETKRQERAGIQVRIRELAAKRTEFVRGEMEKQGLDDSKSLDKAVRDAIREQAGAKGFHFEAPPAPAPAPATAK
jgi:hypothetical protein